METVNNSSSNIISPLKQEGNSMKDHPLAAFSLASLGTEQNRSGSLSLMNLNMNFDTGAFFKSGSFDCLNNILGSSIFKDQNGQLQTSISIPIPSLNTETKVQLPITPTNQTAPLTAFPPAHQSYNAVGAPSNSHHHHMNVNVTPLPVVNNVTIKSIVPASIPSNVLSTSTGYSPQQIMPYNGNGVMTLTQSERTAITERKDDNSKFVDVTPFLTLPQHEAAKKLGIPSSTLAKRWKEASCNRKWPYRTVSKLDKEILTLLKNVENAKAELSPSVEATLGLLLKKRQEELKTVLVRL